MCIRDLTVSKNWWERLCWGGEDEYIKRRSNDCEFLWRVESDEVQSFSEGMNIKIRLRQLHYCYVAQGGFVSLVSKMLGSSHPKFYILSVKLKSQSIYWLWRSYKPSFCLLAYRDHFRASKSYAEWCSGENMGFDNSWFEFKFHLCS